MKKLLCLILLAFTVGLFVPEAQATPGVSARGHALKHLTHSRQLAKKHRKKHHRKRHHKKRSVHTAAAAKKSPSRLITK